MTVKDLVFVMIVVAAVFAIIIFANTSNSEQPKPRKATLAESVMVDGFGTVTIAILPSGERILFTGHAATLLPPLKVEEVK